MALGGNSNGTGNSDPANGTKQNGDVLAQLAANRATVKDVYLLEKGMNTTLNKIEKNQEKANSVLSNLFTELKSGHKVMSSVDTKLQQIINKLSAGGSGTKGSSVLETTVLDIASYVNDCSSYLDEIRELLKNIDDRGSAKDGIPPEDDATKGDSLTDIYDVLTDILGETQIISEIGMRQLEAQRDFFQMMRNIPWDRGGGPRRKDKDDDDDDEDDKDSQREKASKQFMEDMLSDVLGDNFDVLSGDTLKQLTTILGNWGNNQYITGDVVNGVGSVLGDMASTAIATAIPGVGLIIGSAVDKAITNATKAVSDYLMYFIEKANKNRDTIIEKALDKIRKDVTAMATYSVDIQEKSLQKIYDAWDQNMSTVNATQGYTKEALNSLQDSVAQRLQREGYGSTINAGDYITQLTNTLNAKLGGSLAEAFAAQNLILQKAVPELDLSSMAADFAAIYTNAEKQGLSGEDAMVAAMNQVAGAVKALEETTGGNNQFITQVGTFLKKAEEVVNRSGGTADQIADLTTQMMAAEAPISALVPQLSGFTNTMVDTLMKGNDSTAVALRAIMNDINSNIGISATDFMTSFVSDTQGTLATAYEAISQFISTNESPEARQEFLAAMQNLFGLQADQIAQIDFAEIAEEIRNASTATNTKALTAAENLVRSGETTSWEDQLINNTTNQLLATNAVRDTIDNKLMRQLESNELQLEKAVYELQATQVVDFADKTLTFFKNIFDVVQKLIDPFGLFDGISTIADTIASDSIDKMAYTQTQTASQVGSTVTTFVDELKADVRSQSNMWGTAQQLAIDSLITKSVEGAKNTIELVGTSDTFKEMISKHNDSMLQSTVTSWDKSLETSLASLDVQKQQVEQQEALFAQAENQYAQIQAQQAAEEAARKQKEESEQNQNSFNERTLSAAQQQRTLLQAQQAMTTANHDNIEAIRESVSKLDELSNYLSPILDENRNQSNLLQTLSEKVDQLIQTVAAKAVTTTVTSPTPNVNTSYNERDRIYGPIKTW